MDEPKNESRQGGRLRSGSLVDGAVFLAILALGAWFRFHDLGIKPLHHDEGVNSYFLLNLADYGEYKYDPTNYHGPMLYYFALVFLRLMGRTEAALRMWPALCGLLTAGLIWPLRRRLGRFGTPAAALLIAVSPGLVYFSRDFIHEMAFGCFTLGMVVGAARYLESGSFVWMLLLAVSTGLLLTTKETAVITIPVFLLAALCAEGWRRVRESMGGAARETVPGEASGGAGAVRHMPTLDHLLSAAILIVFIYVILYSSILTNRAGVTDFFRSIWHWTAERSSSDHVHPFYYYLGILARLELPLLIGAAVGGTIIIFRGSRFWLFVWAWTCGTFLAYSAIRYKTPWLAVSLLIPMALVSGHAVESIVNSLRGPALKAAALAVTVGWIALSGTICYRLNFRNYDNNHNPDGYFTSLGRRLGLKPYIDEQYGYVYAQTDRDLLEMIRDLEAETGGMPEGEAATIYIASPDYWPLPWYLRRYGGRVIFGGTLDSPDGRMREIRQDLIIAGLAQQARLDGTPGWSLILRSYTLRPGIELVVFKRDGRQTMERNGQ